MRGMASEEYFERQICRIRIQIQYDIYQTHMLRILFLFVLLSYVFTVPGLQQLPGTFAFEYLP